MSAITTHVLDTAEGRPAAGVPVSLARWTEDGWQELATAVTDADGRVRELGPAEITAGRYRLHFDTETYWAGSAGFFPEIAVTVTITDPAQHYHVPILLSPFAFSTYRGS